VKIRIVRLVLVLMLAAGISPALAAELKPIKSQKANDLTVTLSSESGHWTQGKNTFVVDFTGTDKKPIDTGKATLNTSMPMPGMAPMVAGATLKPDGPGHYRGSINFPDRGDRRVTVTWDGPAGKGSTTFSVPVR
jgi:hypothetical protein